MGLRDYQSKCLFWFGSKTIALYDTLIENHTDEELLAVLAHEVGHYKKNHVFKGLVLSLARLD